MNRRGFLGRLAGLVTLPIWPARVPAPELAVTSRAFYYATNVVCDARSGYCYAVGRGYTDIETWLRAQEKAA